jgi:hypothetical protein
LAHEGYELCDWEINELCTPTAPPTPEQIAEMEFINQGFNETTPEGTLIVQLPWMSAELHRKQRAF